MSFFLPDGDINIDKPFFKEVGKWRKLLEVVDIYIYRNLIQIPFHEKLYIFPVLFSASTPKARKCDRVNAFFGICLNEFVKSFFDTNQIVARCQCKSFFFQKPKENICCPERSPLHRGGNGIKWEPWNKPRRGCDCGRS